MCSRRSGWSSPPRRTAAAAARRRRPRRPRAQRLAQHAVDPLEEVLDVARDAAGCAFSRSQSVSVVPMIQCRPQGITKSTDSRCAGTGRCASGSVAGHHQVDALAGLDVHDPAAADELLDVVGPDAGGVDDHAGADPRSAPVSRSVASPGHPLALAQEPGHLDPRRTWAPWVTAVRATISCGGRRRPGRPSTAPPRSAPPAAGRARPQRLALGQVTWTGTPRGYGARPPASRRARARRRRRGAPGARSAGRGTAPAGRGAAPGG